MCFVRSRSRHFSPSLPGRGSTQGRGPTGVSDRCADISGIVVMVGRSSPTSRGTSSCLPFFCFVLFLNQCKRNCSAYYDPEKKGIKEPTSSVPGSTPLFIRVEILIINKVTLKPLRLPRDDTKKFKNH